MVNGMIYLFFLVIPILQFQFEVPEVPTVFGYSGYVTVLFRTVLLFKMLFTKYNINIYKRNKNKKLNTKKMAY